MIPLRRPEDAGAKAKGGSGAVSAPSAGGNWTDLDRQSSYDPSLMTLASVFQGIAFTALIPPDDNLSVGLKSDGTTQVVQLVNTNYAIYNSSGGQIASGDIALNLFYSLSNSVCSSEDGGDPVVLYDKLDGRWIIGQLAYNSTFTDNHYCLAISQSSDAAGSYDLYDIPFSSNLPDYPKLAVWPDGIYFSANIFVPQGTSEQFVGAQACSFPRSDVTSPPAQGITFSCSPGNDATVYNILPADLENMPGTATLPGGSDYYLQFVTNLSPSSGNILRLYQFDPTAGLLNHVSDLTVNNFYEACGGGTCIAQAGTTQLLDSLGDRLMYRLSYRAYDNYDQMVVNQAVQVDSSSQQTGIRWYALRSDAGGPFYVNTESTFSPDSTYYRWMGSIAQNKNGDLGLGYSLSGVTSVPGIAVTGLLNGTDTLMEQEQRMYNGSDQSYQGTYSRWGDYSSMSVDPSDDCSFWYTTEYTSPPVLIFDYIWYTVIGKFNFGDCSGTTFAVTTGSLPQATVLALYSATLTATGGTTPYSWSGSGLPTWLSLDPNTGAISGTSSTTGTFSFDVTVTDNGGATATKTLSMTVNPAPSITTTSPLPSGTVGTLYSATLAATGGTTPYSWSGSGLPTWLSLDPNTGGISGTPSTTGTFSFDVTLTDANSATATTNLSMTVNTAPPSITTTSLPNGTVGTAYSTTLSATGGTTPYSWSGSGLPTWLSLDTNMGVISGTLSTTGTFSFDVTVTDTDGGTATKTLSLTVNPAPSITTTSPLPSGTVGLLYSATLAATGGTTPYSWSGSGLPTWLSLDPNMGVISGTPSTTGTFSFDVTVTDNDGATATKTISLTVNPATTGSFSLSASLGNLTLKTGQSNSYTVTVTPSGGFTGSVDLNVSGCPGGTSCSMVPSTVTITGTTAVSSLLAVTNNGAGRTSSTLTVIGTSEADPSLTSSTSVSLRTH